MIEGLFKVAFRTPRGSGSGVISILNEQFEGGDSCIYYYGTLHENNGAITAHLEARRHSPGMASVFGVDNVSADLAGTIISSTQFSFVGPDGFSAMITKLEVP